MSQFLESAGQPEAISETSSVNDLEVVEAEGEGEDEIDEEQVTAEGREEEDVTPDAELVAGSQGVDEALPDVVDAAELEGGEENSLPDVDEDLGGDGVPSGAEASVDAEPDEKVDFHAGDRVVVVDEYEP